MSGLIVVIASLAVLASSKTLRGKTAFQQSPGTSDDYETGDQKMTMKQGDLSEISVHQFDDGSEGTPTSSDDSGDDHLKSEETSDDADSSVQGGKKLVKPRVMIADSFKQDPDMSADEDSTLATAHGSSSDTMTHELPATETDGSDEAVQSSGVDSTETQDADAVVSESQDDASTRELSPAGEGDDEQVTATGGGSGNMKSDNSEITEHLKNVPDLSPHELVDAESDTHTGTPMNVADSDTMEYDGEHDDAESLASQGKPSESSTQDHEGATEGDNTPAVSATGDESGDAATVQLKEDLASDSEDTSDDLSSSA